MGILREKGPGAFMLMIDGFCIAAQKHLYPMRKPGHPDLCIGKGPAQFHPSSVPWRYGLFIRMDQEMKVIRHEAVGQQITMRGNVPSDLC